MVEDYLDRQFKAHIERAKSQVNKANRKIRYSDWIVENTKINNKPYSFVNHEYQKTILDDDAQEIVVKKPSQIGITELSLRRAMAQLQLYSGFVLLYIFPTASFSQLFAKTRLQVIIDGSQTLKENICRDTDSSLVKRFMNDSFFYTRGASGQSQAISIDTDSLYFDEVDFCDQTTLSTFTSRLTHSEFKQKFFLSTPTVPKYGISAYYDLSKQHVELVKCCHCNYYFWPDYYKHVRWPGFNKPLREVKKIDLARHDLSKAYVACPKCDRPASLDIEHREWVIKNPDATYMTSGYQLTPFSAPNIVTPGDLIKMSTEYERHADFVNFGLGLSIEDDDSGLGTKEVKEVFVHGPYIGGPCVMGLDMGSECACQIGQVDAWGNIHVVHSELIPLRKLKERRMQLCAEYNVVISVIDWLPYSDMVMSIQDIDPNAWASVFVTSKGIDVFQIKEREHDEETGMQALKQVSVNRDRALDAFMVHLRGGGYTIHPSDNDKVIIDHLTDMKRIRKYADKSELSFTWQKSSKKTDHYHFAALYMFIASKMRGLVSSHISIGTMVGSFKTKGSV